MNSAIDEPCSLLGWSIGPGTLRLELLREGPSFGAVPSGEAPFLTVVVTDPGPVAGLEDQLEILREEGVWDLREETTAEGARLAIEGEGWTLDVSGSKVHLCWEPLQARHYVQLHEQLAAYAAEVASEADALRQGHARVVTYLQLQIARATRILADAPKDAEAARQRAEGRLHVAREALNKINQAEE